MTHVAGEPGLWGFPAADGESQSMKGLDLLDTKQLEDLRLDSDNAG